MNREKAYFGILSDVFIFFMCILISLLILFFNQHDGYNLLFTQPILFSIVYILLFSKIIRNDKKRVFFIVLTSVSFIRYVLLPLLIVLSGYYGGRSAVEPESESFFKAILLMNYELMICALLIAIMEKRRNKNHINVSNENLEIRNNDVVYYIVILLSIFLLFLFPSVLNKINFIFPSSMDAEFSFLENIVVYLTIISKQLFFILVSKKLFLNYKRSNKEIFIFLNFLFAILNISIYFGTNRTDIITSATVSFLLLYKLYGKRVIKYSIFGATLLIFLITSVTNYREPASITKNPNVLVETADTFQVYTGGPYNVAIALETKEYFPEAKDPSVLFFDIFRPMIGVNIFIKDLPFKYSNIYFNERIWLDIDRRSQILPMIGQGNLFFGFFLAPIFSILFIFIYYYLERRSLTTKNLEIFYFLSLVNVRLGFFMGQNTMNLINDMSMNLVLFLLIFYINKLVKNSMTKKRARFIKKTSDKS